MKRSEFIKNMFIGAISMTSFTPNRTIWDDGSKKEFLFDELFTIHPGNDRLIYPKVESEFYQEIRKCIEDDIMVCSPTYLGIHDLIIPIKEKYVYDDLINIKYFFEKKKPYKYTEQGSGVCFRFIKDQSDRMHLDLFVKW